MFKKKKENLGVYLTDVGKEKVVHSRVLYRMKEAWRLNVDTSLVQIVRPGYPDNPIQS